jgi:hypothetical protein
VVLTSNSYSETVRVKLPVGFDVDELPDAVKLDTAFGIYNTSYDVKDGHLTFKRSLIQHATTIPIEKYAAVRSFFEKIRAAEQARWFWQGSSDCELFGIECKATR